MNLNDLADVDTTGANDDDRLTWDDGLSLWVPKPPVSVEFTRYHSSITYPSGDGGWVWIENDVEQPDGPTGSSLPENDAAMLTSFTVTSAMLPTETGDPASQFGLLISASGTPSTDGTRNVFFGATVNDVQVASALTSVSAARDTLGFRNVVPCKVGDVVKLHGWHLSGSVTVDWLWLMASPILVAVYPQAREETDGTVGWVTVMPDAVPAFSVLATAPAALSSFTIQGSPVASSNYGLVRERDSTRPDITNYQIASDAIGTSPVRMAACRAPLSVVNNYLGVFTQVLNGDSALNSSAIDPYVWRQPRIASYDFHVAELTGLPALP